MYHMYIYLCNFCAGPGHLRVDIIIGDAAAIILQNNGCPEGKEPWLKK